jgi:HSP20 family protein
MAIQRYRPSSDVFRPLFEDMLSPFGRMGSSMRIPDTDVVESKDEIRVICELPGLSGEDVDISLENNVLTISGEKHEEREDGGADETYHMSERRWGRFSRSFVLPREVDQERIGAEFDNGVLTVRIPKSEKAKPRRIEIGKGVGNRSVSADETRKKTGNSDTRKSA